MNQYLYEIHDENDIEKIADDIYGQDLLCTARSVVITLFSCVENDELLAKTIRSFEERYPEVEFVGSFVYMKKEDEISYQSAMSLTVLENFKVNKITGFDISEEEKNIDYLTGVYTRAEIDKIIDENIAHIETYHPAIVLADIDRLEQINVNLGHDAGDYVMKRVASLCLENFRSEDTIGRWESEKFMIILHDVDEKKAPFACDRIRKIIEEADFADVGKVTLSMGLSIIKSDSNKEELIQKAEEALKIAKENGRNRFEIL